MASNNYVVNNPTFQQQSQQLAKEIKENERKIRELESSHSKFLKNAIRWNRYYIPISLIIGIFILYLGVMSLYIGFGYLEIGSTINGLINTLLGLINIGMGYINFKQNKKYKEEYEQRVVDGI